MKINPLLLQIIQNGIVPDKCCRKELRARYVKTYFIEIYEGWNFNSDNYLFTTDTK